MNDKFFQDLLILKLNGKDVHVLTDPIAKGLRNEIKRRLAERHVPENWEFLTVLFDVSKNEKQAHSKHKKQAVEAVAAYTCREIIESFIDSKTAGDKEINISSEARKSLVENKNPSLDDFEEVLKTVATLVRDPRNLTRSNGNENTEELMKDLSEIYHKDELIGAALHIQSELKFAADMEEMQTAVCTGLHQLFSRTKYHTVVNDALKSADKFLEQAKTLPTEQLEIALQKMIDKNKKVFPGLSARLTGELKLRMEDLGNVATVEQAKAVAKEPKEKHGKLRRMV